SQARDRQPPPGGGGEPAADVLPPPVVSFAEHADEDASLRRAGVGVLDLAGLGQDPGFEERLDQSQHALVLDPRPDPVHQPRVIDLVESTRRCPRPAPSGTHQCRNGGSRRPRPGRAAGAGTRTSTARSPRESFTEYVRPEFYLKVNTQVSTL